MSLVGNIISGLTQGIIGSSGLIPPNPDPNGGTARQQLLALSPALALVPADGDKTYSSGSLVSSIVDEAGVTWVSAAGDELTYNAPTLDCSDAARHIRASKTASGDMVIVMYVYFPATISITGTIACFTTSTTTGSANSSLIVNSAGTLVFPDTVGTTTIGTGLLDTWALITLKFTNGGTCTAQVNDQSPVTFSPNTTYATGTVMHMAARQPNFSSVSGMKFGDVFVFNQAINTPSQASMLSFYQGIYG